MGYDVFERKKITATFATTATTSVNTYLSGDSYSGPGHLRGLFLKTHTWTTLEAAASGASGGIVTIFDSDGNTIKTFGETTSGTSVTMLSGSTDIQLFHNYLIQYKISTPADEPRVVSGADRSLADFTHPTIILFIER